ncbi:MAG: hypothetical protein M1815_001011 [Lichina confinis]|nr:MAG: hypothetical protein M1815_001011 [Lichina confinis]
MALRSRGEQPEVSRDEVRDASDDANNIAELEPSTSEQSPSLNDVDEPASASSSYALSATGIIQESFDVPPRRRRASSSATSATTIVAAGQVTPTHDTNLEGSNVDAQQNEDPEALYLAVPANQTDAMLQLVQRAFSGLEEADKADPETRAEMRRRLATEWIDRNNLLLPSDRESGESRMSGAPRGPLAILDTVGSVLERHLSAANVVPPADDTPDQKTTSSTEAIPPAEDNPDQQAASTSAPKDVAKKKKDEQRSASAVKARRKRQVARRKAKREGGGAGKADEDDKSDHGESGHDDTPAAQSLSQEHENDVCDDVYKRRTKLIISQTADERSDSQTAGLAGAEVRDSIEDPETPKDRADVGSSGNATEPDVSGSLGGRASPETVPGPGTSESKSATGHGEDDEGKRADLASSADGEAQITLEHALPDAVNSTGFHDEPSLATSALEPLEQDGKTEGCKDTVSPGNSRSQSPKTYQQSGSVDTKGDPDNTPHPTTSAPHSDLSNVSSPSLPVIEEEAEVEMSARPSAEKTQGKKKKNRKSKNKKQMGSSDAGEGTGTSTKGEQSSDHGERANIGAPDKNETPPVDRGHESEEKPAVESGNMEENTPNKSTDKQEDSAASTAHDESVANVRKSRSDSIKFIRARTFSRSSANSRSSATDRPELLSAGPDVASTSASAALSSETAVFESDSGDSEFPARAVAEEVSRPATATSQETVSERTVATRTSTSSTRLNPEASAFQPGAGVHLGPGMPMPDPMGFYAAAGAHPPAALPPPGHGGHYVPPIAMTEADILRYIAADEEYQKWKATDAKVPPPDVQAAFDRREAERQARIDNAENQPPPGSGAENAGPSEHQGSQEGSSTSPTQTHAADDSAARSVLTDPVNIEHAHVGSTQQDTSEAVGQAGRQVQDGSAPQNITSAQPQSEPSERSIVGAYVLPETSRLRDEVMGPDMRGPDARPSRASRSDTVVRHEPSDQPRQRAASQAAPTTRGENRVDGGSRPASQPSGSNTGSNNDSNTGSNSGSNTRTVSGSSSGRGGGGNAGHGQRGRGHGSNRGQGRQQQGRQQQGRQQQGRQQQGRQQQGSNQQGSNEQDRGQQGRNQQGRNQQGRNQQGGQEQTSTSQGPTPQAVVAQGSTPQAPAQEAPTPQDASAKGSTSQAPAQKTPIPKAAVAQGSPSQAAAPESSTSQAPAQKTPTPKAAVAQGSTSKAPVPEGSKTPTSTKKTPTTRAIVAQDSTPKAPVPGGSKTPASAKETPTTQATVARGSTSKVLAPEGSTSPAPAQKTPTPKAAATQGSTSKGSTSQAPAKEAPTTQATVAQGSTSQAPAPEGSKTQAPAQDAPGQDAPAEDALAQQGRKRAATYAATVPSSSSPPQVPTIHNFKELLFKCTWCGLPLSDRTPTTMICNGCGPFSPTRYCSHEHMMSGLYLHEPVCGTQSLNILVDIQSLPERYLRCPPAIWNIYGHRTRALLRQRHFSTLRHDECDYVIFRDAEAQEEAGCYVLTMKPLVFIRLDDDEARDITNRLLNVAFLNHMLVRPLLLLYRLLRRFLRTCEQWNPRIKRELDRQFLEEFLLDPNHMVRDSNPDLEVEWYGEGGIEEIVSDQEERYGVLRIWRREHPNEALRADPWSRYFGFQWPNARVPRDFGLGPGWDGPVREKPQTEAQVKAEAANEAENLARAQAEIMGQIPLQGLRRLGEN